ncbi:MAG TPA: hypothetical protein VKB41_07045 [Steroidobacteraceae bacterium]|nr:hypothetical protein [Steroidobacteraceae bacterium]
MRRTLAWLAVVGLLLGPATAFSQTITRYARFVGNINFVATGGSLRTQPNTGDACAVGATSTAAVAGIPAGATITAAYLYWGGSQTGATIDSNVTFNGNAITASRTFTTTFNNGGTLFPYFGGFADVTTRVAGNGNYTFGGLTVNTGAPHCGSQAVVAGWGLIVIYQRAAEDLRAINVFDGLQFFRGSAITLNPDGFRVPVAPINGKMTIVAWEGDPQNSDPLNGFSEQLSFNGNALDDGIVVAGSDPITQPYDGTVNTLGIATSYGVDVDTFTVDPYISQGQTSATTTFSAGGDLVLLTAQVVSVTSEPSVDLSLTKTHTGDFSAGTNGTYTIRVSNGTGVGLEEEDNIITVTDTLPAGLTYVSGTGTGWTCSNAAQTVTCNHPPPLAMGATLPDLSLTVLPGSAASPSVTNTAVVSSASLDFNAANDTATDATNVKLSNLSTSTKTVADLNAGDANPGDTLRYTITLRETAGILAPGVRITDDVPANVSSFTVTTLPAGAVNNSTGSGTGVNGDGFVDISNITVPANGTVTVTFDVVIANGTPPGATLDNTATVVNQFGTGATPAAAQVIVSQSQIPSTGGKVLYLYGTPGQQLSRTPPAGTPASINIVSLGGQATWVQTPALQTSLSLPAGNIPVQLWLTRSGTNGARSIVVNLIASGGIGSLGTATLSVTPPTGNPALSTFTIPVTARVLPVGTTLSLQVTNNGANNRPIQVFPVDPVSLARSNVSFNSNTVINVNSVTSYNAAYAGGVATASFFPGATVYMRAVVSDPFGSFDVSSASMTLLNPSSGTVLNAVAMTQVADSGTSTRTYEVSYALPAAAPAGSWTMRVTAREGTENTVTDLGVGTFAVVIPQPTLIVTRTSQVISDPYNNATNPKRIPGSVQMYSLTITNQGPGTVDSSTLVISEFVPPNSDLYVSTASGDPVAFVNGTPVSGLSYVYASNVTYSNQPGGVAPYNYTPVPDANGFDPNVTGMRIAPTGVMNAAGGSGNPSFTIRFRVRLR